MDKDRQGKLINNVSSTKITKRLLAGYRFLVSIKMLKNIKWQMCSWAADSLLDYFL